MLAVAAHSPSNGEVQVVLGILYNISQDFDNAIDCFRKAVDFSPPDYSLLNKVRRIITSSSSFSFSSICNSLLLNPNFLESTSHLLYYLPVLAILLFSP